MPTQVLTLAEHMHQAGYQTAELTTNSNAGSMSDLDRGNDVFREAGVGNQSTSSVQLHEISGHGARHTQANRIGYIFRRPTCTTRTRPSPPSQDSSSTPSVAGSQTSGLSAPSRYLKQKMSESLRRSIR